MDITREQIKFDVLFVGAGPACLAGAIHLMKLAKNRGLKIEAALIEKGRDIGSHALSGAVLNPVALKELMEDYRERGCPIEVDVRGDKFVYLTGSGCYGIPFVPGCMHNKGFHIVSVSRFVSWLGGIAARLGVNLFPGFAGKEVLYGDDGKTIIGVRTGDKGVGRDNTPKANFEPGIDVLAKVTVFGEGPRGSLFKEVSKRLQLFEGRMPQVFETGIKEVIQVPAGGYFSQSKANDIHTLGYPLGLSTPGGGFIYEMKENRISLGLIVGLAYQDPMLDLYEGFTRFKRHPFVSEVIQGGRVIEQGARAIVTGGYYAMPKLAVGGGLFVGGSASMLDAPALKGIHTSMKSGMLAAEAIVEAFSRGGDFTEESLGCYRELFEGSWLKRDMYRGRNFAGAISKKGLAKFFHLGAQYLTGGRGLFNNMPLEDDSRTLVPLRQLDAPMPHEKQEYDGVLFVDKLTGVSLSGTRHREDQPNHLIIHDMGVCVNECFETYRCPCTRFCPGKVYELEIDDRTGERRLKLSPANCLHCKTCDIKDPYGNITWTCPEGGDGPRYSLA